MMVNWLEPDLIAIGCWMKPENLRNGRQHLQVWPTREQIQARLGETRPDVAVNEQVNPTSYLVGRV